MRSKQLIDVENVADRLAGLVQDGQIRQASPQPRRLHVVGPGQNPAALGVANRADDLRRQTGVRPGDHADAVGQIAGRGAIAGSQRINQDGLADLDLIAGMEQGVLDGRAVDEDAVGAAAVMDAITAAVESEAEFGVPAGNFGIVEMNGVRRIPADAEDGARQSELSAFVNSLNDHRRGTPRPPSDVGNVPVRRGGCQEVPPPELLGDRRRLAHHSEGPSVNSGTERA